MLVTQRQPFASMASTRRSTSSNHHGPSLVYAVPASRNHGSVDGPGTEGLSYAEHELLRSRKTPHGRIDEEHEIHSLDKNVYVPASKHLLLSVSPQDLIHRPYVNSTPSRGGVSRHGQSRVHEPIQPISNGSFLDRDFFGGVDSVLNQTVIAHDQNQFYHARPRVPTVLPATLHTYLGPTASAGQQYYGPYWPDGTFSPYRPAPIRDSRFHEHAPFIEPQTAPAPEIRPLRRSGRLPITRGATVVYPENAGPKYRDDQLYMPFYDRVLAATQQMNLPPTHGNDINYSSRTTVLPLLDQIPFHLFDTGQQHKPLLPGEASDKIAFRDRTFSWAHQIYVDLLTKIQRENKPNHPNNHVSGQPRASTKPAIFPKPPQRSGSYFKDFKFPLRTKSEARNARLNAWPKQAEADDERPQTAFHIPQRRASDLDSNLHPLMCRSSPPADIPQSIPPMHVRCGSDLNVHRSTHHHYPPSPPLAAVSALEKMELLCNEADSTWSDGMLLAGCLAYGLGDYTKALTWYQKILFQDPNHVEAMSNLAATLLALGRRDEALRNWSAAVRSRPSYFEAVEHLIGLLCAVQKAKEAVEMIKYVESCLKLPPNWEMTANNEPVSDGDSDTHSRTSSTTSGASNDAGVFDYDSERWSSASSCSVNSQATGFGSSGYAIPGCDNGRLLALIHAKGNMLYGLGDNGAAASSFEDAILIATGHTHSGICGLIRRILHSCVSRVDQHASSLLDDNSKDPILLTPDRAQQTANRMFPPNGELPGLEFVQKGPPHRAAVSTTSNSLLSLAKIYQDGMGNPLGQPNRRARGTREILALYYLSLSLQRSPSTANNVGILLASVQQTTNIQVIPQCTNNQIINYAGIAPGSSISLALQYYNYGLNIDNKHAHLYTNLGSLLKDLGQLNSAIKMYEIAVQCDGSFDIALANLANAVKDQGRTADAIMYYRKAVQANPEFAEAVCGLATALNSVCNWYGRGGVYADHGRRDRFHVDEDGKLQEARRGCGWMNRVVEIVGRQLKDGEHWGLGTLTAPIIEQVCQQLMVSKSHLPIEAQQQFWYRLQSSLREWSGKKWEGARLVRLIERANRVIGWQWYQDRYKLRREYSPRRYIRPSLPSTLSSPTAPTVLPFHTFTTPLSAKQVRQISQRNALRISVAALRSPWLPTTVYPPPPPPSPSLHVGYVSSDFNNHPLAHLMQSVFGLHDRARVRAFCYATTSSDGSVHRQQIERESPVFHDASSWNVEKLVAQIVKDGIHILVNLNGYTRGAKNEVFAARPAPIHMSFMGFAGTLGAEWCDYVFADPISVLPNTLSSWRRNVDIEDRLHPDALAEDGEDWMYSENVIFAKSTFFCVDHKQSAPDAGKSPSKSEDWAQREDSWRSEQDRRWRLRKELFPTLSDSAIILGNFNQLYKIDPSTFRIYLRILTSVPHAVLWLLRFPDVGEQNLKNFAHDWAGKDVASRIIFTDVAPKGAHITRASVVDLFLDTPECNAHTTAADVIWSGTPMVTWARWDYKMCSRMASSIVASALPEGSRGDEARQDLLVGSEEQYEQHAVSLASGLRYCTGSHAGRGRGRLMDLRRMLWEGRWTSRLFDTRRWVRDLETAYWLAWERWEKGEGGDIWL